MRAHGARGSCGLCHHRAIMNADAWTDHVSVPTFGPRIAPLPPAFRRGRFGSAALPALALRGYSGDHGRGPDSGRWTRRAGNCPPAIVSLGMVCTALPHHRRRARAELEGTAAAREPDGDVMAPLNSERQRALRLLAKAPNGCTEALMLAHGFTYELLDRLVVQGVATTQRHRMRAGRRSIEMTWLTITDGGRRALEV
jgi:hypothetical protein